MRISLQGGNNARSVALGGAFLCAALMLSLAESLLFPAGFLPIPGAKLGLANSAVLLCAAMMGRAPALAMSIARVLLMFILFGNGSSALYSLFGALLSFVGIALLIGNTRLSFIGKSVVSAVLHNTAQLICGAMIMGRYVMLLLPAMMLAALLSGLVTGIILNIIYPMTAKIISCRPS